jgi:hypothetical protein
LVDIRKEILYPQIQGVTVRDAKRHAGNFEPAEVVKSVPLDPSNDACKQF